MVDDAFTLSDARALLESNDTMLMADSIRVSERFGKLHRQVVRDIEDIECSQEFYRANFKQLEFVDGRGRSQPMYRMTRDGFSLLVMGFSGPKAMLWKERYILAFNMLEAAELAESIERAETRGRSKTVRVAATDSYKLHGATEWFHYVNNTDAIYEIMFGGSAGQLRKRWNLPPKANVRDYLSSIQLNTVVQIENAITLQLDARKVFHPDDQLKIVEHVARSYKALQDTPIPGLMSASLTAKAPM